VLIEARHQTGVGCRVEAGGTAAKAPAECGCHGDLIIGRSASHAELGAKLVGLVCTAQLSAQGGCPQIEGIGEGTGGGGRIEGLAGAAVADLGLLLLLLRGLVLLLLLLLLELLEVLLALGLSQELSLVLLGLDSLLESMMRTRRYARQERQKFTWIRIISSCSICICIWAWGIILGAKPGLNGRLLGFMPLAAWCWEKRLLGPSTAAVMGAFLCWKILCC
jgi:hypothetical protein